MNICCNRSSNNNQGRYIVSLKKTKKRQLSKQIRVPLTFTREWGGNVHTQMGLWTFTVCLSYPSVLVGATCHWSKLLTLCAPLSMVQAHKLTYFRACLCGCSTEKYFYIWCSRFSARKGAKCCGGVGFFFFCRRGKGLRNQFYADVRKHAQGPRQKIFGSFLQWTLTVAVFSFITLNFLSPVLKVGILSMHGPASVRPIKSTNWKSVGSTCTKWKHVNMVNLSGEELCILISFFPHQCILSWSRLPRFINPRLHKINYKIY